MSWRTGAPAWLHGDLRMRAILTYHSIDGSGSPISVDGGTFQGHMEWLAEGPVRVMSLGDLMSDPGGEDAVAITFDDGFVNLETEAAPVLADHGFTATVYVVSEHAGGTNAWGGKEQPGIPVLPLLDWEGVGRMMELGLSVGAHTRTHSALTQMGTAQLDDEITGSGDRILERTGTRPSSFAYPYGAWNREAAERVAASYAWGVTTGLRTLREDAADPPSLLPRLDAFYFRRPGQLEAWGSPGFRWRLRARAGARRMREVMKPAGGRRQ
ncbi:MAG: polysaccharide deacetylase family protein [Gemmatimonadales bacterium]